MNIEIRRLEPGDYKAVQQIHAQPNAVRGTLQLPFPSEEAWKERLTKPTDRHYNLVACVDGELVAIAALTPSSPSPRRNHAGEVALVVHDKWRSRGVGTALLGAVIDLADKWLNLSRLELTVFADNEPAVRLYKKLGFVIEGTHTKYAFRDGAFVDAYSMARVR